MDHKDHVALLRDGIPALGGVWADLGSGHGAFTLALADLLGISATIYSLDKDRSALHDQEQAMRANFPDRSVTYRAADFTDDLNLPPLDGIVMANALHFHRRKDAIVQRLYHALKPDGRLLLVEYNVDSGNMWVPHPLSFPTWQRLATANGFAETRFLASRPSRFLKEIYSALSVK